MRAPSNKHFIHGGIFLLSNRLQTTGDRLTGEISSRQWFMLLVISQIEEGHATISEIARVSGSTRQNAAKMADALERKGYVTTQPLPQDRRSRAVFLTNKARAHIASISAAGQHYINRLFQGISEEAIAQTVSVFQAMFHNLESMEREGL